MKNLGTMHLILLFFTVVFIGLTMYLCSKLPKKWQNLMFIFGALMCAGGIFWRYALNMTLSPFSLHIDTLLIQLLQVCNFNFLLVILMLVPKFELARQYSAMFSMFAAATVMVSIPTRYAAAEWYSPDFLNFWLNHVFAIALPLWMIASGNLKPKKKYIIPVAICVIVYFLAVYGGTEWLRAIGKIDAAKSFSYVHDPAGIGLLETLYKLIPAPCFYLAALIPPMLGFFYALAWLFERVPSLLLRKGREPRSGGGIVHVTISKILKRTNNPPETKAEAEATVAAEEEQTPAAGA